MHFSVWSTGVVKYWRGEIQTIGSLLEIMIFQALWFRAFQNPRAMPWPNCPVINHFHHIIIRPSIHPSIHLSIHLHFSFSHFMFPSSDRPYSHSSPCFIFPFHAPMILPLILSPIFIFIIVIHTIFMESILIHFPLATDLPSGPFIEQF